MVKIYLLAAVVLSTAASQADRLTCIQAAPSKEAARACFPKNISLETNPDALFHQALIHLFIETPAEAQGIQALTLSATFNHPLALEMLAGFYLHGKFVEKNEQKALALYSRAAHLGYGPAQFNCGIMYKNGQGTPPDLVRAYLYLEAASHNIKDLDHLADDAARYCAQVAEQLTAEQRKQADHMRSMLVHGGGG